MKDGVKTEALPDIHSKDKRLQPCIDRIDNEKSPTKDKQLFKSNLQYAATTHFVNEMQ